MSNLNFFFPLLCRSRAPRSVLLSRAPSWARRRQKAASPNLSSLPYDTPGFGSSTEKKRAALDERNARLPLARTQFVSRFLLAVFYPRPGLRRRRTRTRWKGFSRGKIARNISLLSMCLFAQINEFPAFSLRLTLRKQRFRRHTRRSSTGMRWRRVRALVRARVCVCMCASVLQLASIGRIF